MAKLNNGLFSIASGSTSWVHIYNYNISMQYTYTQVDDLFLNKALVGHTHTGYKDYGVGVIELSNIIYKIGIKNDMNINSIDGRFMMTDRDTDITYNITVNNGSLVLV